MKAFVRQYYYVDKKGNGYAIDHADQRRVLGNRSYLMPIVFNINNTWIAPNKIFYMTANAAQMRGRAFVKQVRMKYMGEYILNGNDQKELCSMLPNFQLKIFHKWMKFKLSPQQYENEIIFYPYTYYCSFGQVGHPVIGFRAHSQATEKYKEWLGTDNRIFMKPCIKKYRSRLSIVKHCLIKMF